MTQKIEQLMLKFEKVLFSTIMALMAMILVAHVTMRYLFNRPLIWTDEITTLLQGTITFLGIGYCFRNDQHTKLGLLYDRVSPKMQILFDLITNVIMIVCSGYMVKAGLKLAKNQMIQLGTVSWLYKSYFYVCIPIGFTVGILYLMRSLIEITKRVRTLTKGV